MKTASMLAILSLAAIAVPAAAAAAAPAQDLVSVSRAMSAIDAAELKGQIAAERQDRTAVAAAHPKDLVARFLAIYASPRDEDAWNQFKALTSEFKTSAFGPIGMARVYLDWNTLDQADAAFAQALAVDPGNWITLRLRGEAQERRQRSAEARADYQAVLKADPGCAEARVGLARLLRQSGDAAGARREAEATLAAVPGDAGALALLSELALEAGDKKSAAELLVRAVEAAPRDRERRVALAKLQAELGETRPALESWLVALGQREDPEALHAVAELARLASDGKVERRTLERLTQVEPGPAATWRRLADITAAAGETDTAETAWRQVIARDPRDATARVALARVLVQKGDVSAAVGEYRAAGELSAGERAELEKRLNIERLSRKNVNDLQRAVKGLLDRTYRLRLKETAGLSGTLGLRVTVDAAGAPAVVEVTEDSVHDDQVRACAYWNLRDATYPANKPGRYSFSFTLRPGR